MEFSLKSCDAKCYSLIYLRTGQDELYDAQVNLEFDELIFKALVGGHPPMDLPLSLIKTDEDATSFLDGYGYSLTDEVQSEQLWGYFEKSIEYINNYLLDETFEKVPVQLSSREELKDFQKLLLHASNKLEQDPYILNWACAILKVIHVLVHLDNDLFAKFSEEIQQQILQPISNQVYQDNLTGTLLGSPKTEEKIVLHKFATKTFKTSNSSITKLLANPEKVAFTILDKVGVRFVTKNIFDSFRVMHYLVKKNMIGIFHIIPNESNNNLYPIKKFIESVDQIKHKDLSNNEINAFLLENNKNNSGNNDYFIKRNVFSDRKHKFIKFICRKLIRYKISEDKEFSFFYPFEIQILDYESYVNNLSGPTAHSEYKKRQKHKARERVLGFVKKVQ